MFVAVLFGLLLVSPFVALVVIFYPGYRQTSGDLDEIDRRRSRAEARRHAERQSAGGYVDDGDKRERQALDDLASRGIRAWGYVPKGCKESPAGAEVAALVDARKKRGKTQRQQKRGDRIPAKLAS